MRYDGDVSLYIGNIYRRRRLARLEAMASMPTLAYRRLVRPRKGALRRVWSWLMGFINA